MSDGRVQQILRSPAPLVVIEAPAGCGKTYHGAQYARDLLIRLNSGRLLILTHTHAACDVFAQRTKGLDNRVEIRTLDSLIVEIARVYHRGLELPPDVTAWAVQRGSEGFQELAVKVARLLERAPFIASALASRYPYIICDEHQDANEAQHQVVMAIHRAGAILRVFGDPMQAIYGSRKEIQAATERWEALKAAADEYATLTTPHRWKDARELGDWILEVRSALKTGQPVDLRGDLPRGLTIIRADNIAPRYGCFMVNKPERRLIERHVRDTQRLLVLTPTNALVRAMHSFFHRCIPIWEGYTREALAQLVLSCQQHSGNPEALVEAFISFVERATTGFHARYSDVLRREVANRCRYQRKQKTQALQEIARKIVESPDHRGVARALECLRQLITTSDAFAAIKIDLRREYDEACQVVHYDNLEDGLVELHLRRSLLRYQPPLKSICTIHRAKGLETDSVLVVPCDVKHFKATDEKRRLLYVAISRATKSLALVVPESSPSPLFLV